jgi:2-haloacid dehalogenase
MIKAFVFDAYGTLYDTQSVAGAIASAFPRYGDYITQTWRMKQLEYSWLRTLMGTYADFRTVTREALAYTLGTIGISLDERRLNELTDAYDRLQPYPDTRAALEALHDYRLAILSNGSPQMLEALVGNSGLGSLLEAVIRLAPVPASGQRDCRAAAIRETHLQKADRWLRRGHARGRGGPAGETRL